VDSFGASCNEANSHSSHLYANASCKDVLHVFGWKDAMDQEMDNLQGKSLVTCYLLFGGFFFSMSGASGDVSVLTSIKIIERN